MTITEIFNKLKNTNYIREVQCYSTGHELALDDGEYIIATVEPIPEGVKVHMESSSRGTVLVVGSERRDIDHFSYWYAPVTPQVVYEIVEFLLENGVEVPEDIVEETIMLSH
jgi:(2Fe-2S) ferredoxin